MLELPAQFRRHQIAVWAIPLRFLVHSADKPLPARLIGVTDSVEHLIDIFQYRTVEGVVNGIDALIQHCLRRGRLVIDELIFKWYWIGLLWYRHYVCGDGVTRWVTHWDLVRDGLVVVLELFLQLQGVVELLLESSVFCFDALLLVLQTDFQLKSSNSYASCFLFTVNTSSELIKCIKVVRIYLINALAKY